MSPAIYKYQPSTTPGAYSFGNNFFLLCSFLLKNKCFLIGANYWVIAVGPVEGEHEKFDWAIISGKLKRACTVLSGCKHLIHLASLGCYVQYRSSHPRFVCTGTRCQNIQLQVQD